MRIRLHDCHDHFDHVVEVTDQEWERLVAPAAQGPVDGSTVDHGLLDELFDRPNLPGDYEHTIPLV